MTSLQSTLGESSGIAEELAESQRQISIAEFFEKNKHMLGFDSGARGLVTAVKEAVDNALDATEEAGILPDVYVEIEGSGDYYTLIVEDNGPGITKEQIPKVFGKLLYGSRFHKREQSRGQQGIGISAAVLYSQLTSGKPAKITSRTQGNDTAEYFELVIDTDTNEPEIRTEDTTSWDRPHGTRIEIEMEGNMRARNQLHNYIKHTAVVNPHARIELREPQEHFKFERATDQLPDETEEIRPHPHGVELGTLIKMLGNTKSHSLSGFLQEEFTRVGSKTAESVLENFRNLHFGREMPWSAPGNATTADGDDIDVETAVTDAVENKAPDATTAFAEYVADVLEGRERTAYHELETIVENTAETVESEFDTTFGSTVRGHTVEATWAVLTTSRTADLYELVDDATSTRKDDATVHGLADRIASKFEAAENVRDRVTRDDVREYVDRAADMTQDVDDVTVGDTARENIADAIWAVTRTVPDDVPLVREIAEDRNAMSDLLEAMTKADIIAPPTDCLSPITDELLEAGLRKEFDAEFYSAATRDAGVHGGDPFIVEAGIAYGGDLEAEGKGDVLRFANRVPLVYQRGACATTDVVKSIGWRNYNVDQPGGSGLPNGPIVIMVHIASTNVPFTSESKDAVANVPNIESEIELAIREAARKLKSYLKKRRSLQKRKKKQNVIAEILPQMASKLAEVTDNDEPKIGDSLARIMNNVLVERHVEDDTVQLVVENHSGRNEDIDLTDMVSAEPSNLSDGATAVDMDDEWFVKWSTTVKSGETATLEYEIDDEASSDLHVEGVETEKLTINQ